MSNKSTKLALTERDLQITAMAFKCLKSDPQVDYTKLATLGNYKNASTASAVWAPIKKKLLSYAPDAGDKASNGTDAATANGSSTPRKRRTKAAADGDAADGTPKKRGRAAQKAAKHVESEVDDDDEEGQQEVGGVGVKEEEADGADAADQLLDGMDEYLNVKAEEVDF